MSRKGAGKPLPFQFVPVPYSVQDDERLTSIDVLVITALLRFADHESWTCYPAEETICMLARTKIRATRNSLKRLEKLGYITRHRERNRHGEWAKTVYQLHLEPAQAIQPPAPNAGSLPASNAHGSGLDHRHETTATTGTRCRLTRSKDSTRSMKGDPSIQNQEEPGKDGRMDAPSGISWDGIEETFTDLWGSPTSEAVKTLKHYLAEGMEAEVILSAMEEAGNRKSGEAAVVQMRYFFGIMKNCGRDGVKTPWEWQERQKKFEPPKAEPKSWTGIREWLRQAEPEYEYGKITLFDRGDPVATSPVNEPDSLEGSPPSTRRAQEPPMAQEGPTNEEEWALGP